MAGLMLPPGGMLHLLMLLLLKQLLCVLHELLQPLLLLVLQVLAAVGIRSSKPGLGAIVRVLQVGVGGISRDGQKGSSAEADP